MLFGAYKNIDVSEILIMNDVAKMVCTIHNSLDVIQRVQIGESVTTTKPFDLDFPECTSKWMLIFYPNGQYDFGTASRDSRFYIKMLNCNKYDQLTMKIEIRMQSSSLAETHEFIVNDKRRHWAGPYQMESIRKIDFGENLIINCTFELIRKEINFKRRFDAFSRFSRFDPPSVMAAKKNRSLSPKYAKESILKDILDKNVHSFRERRPQFSYRPTRAIADSPEKRDGAADPQKSSQSPPSIKSKSKVEVINPTRSSQQNVLSLSERPPSKFVCKHPRKLIYSPDERDEAKEMMRKKSPSEAGRSEKMYNEYLESLVEPKSSSVSDITLNDRKDKEDKKPIADKNEICSSTINLSEKDERHRREETITKRVQFFEKFAQKKK